jgi:dTDP-glucose 4,6-dehydratase
MDTSRITRELGWQPRHALTQGLHDTVAWYLSNLEWCEQVTAGAYAGARIGLGRAR